MRDGRQQQDQHRESEELHGKCSQGWTQFGRATRADAQPPSGQTVPAGTAIVGSRVIKCPLLSTSETKQPPRHASILTTSYAITPSKLSEPDPS